MWWDNGSTVLGTNREVRKLCFVWFSFFILKIHNCGMVGRFLFTYCNTIPDVRLGPRPTLLAKRWLFSLSISNLHNLCWLLLTGLSLCLSAFIFLRWKPGLKKSAFYKEQKQEGERQKLTDTAVIKVTQKQKFMVGYICSSNAHIKMLDFAAPLRQTQERPCLQLICVCASRGKAA